MSRNASTNLLPVLGLVGVALTAVDLVLVLRELRP